MKKSASPALEAFVDEGIRRGRQLRMLACIVGWTISILAGALAGLFLHFLIAAAHASGFTIQQLCPQPEARCLARDNPDLYKRKGPAFYRRLPAAWRRE